MPETKDILGTTTEEETTQTKEQQERIKKTAERLTPLSGYTDEYYSTLLMDQVEGLYSGFPLLDSNLLGLRQTIVLAGAAKSGKTSFCTQLVEQISRFNGNYEYYKIPVYTEPEKETKTVKQAVLFYSLEMPKADLTTKVISQLSNVSYWKIKLEMREHLEKHGIGSNKGQARPAEIEDPLTKKLKENLIKAEHEQRARMNNVFLRDLTDFKLEADSNDPRPLLSFETVRDEIDAVKSVTGANKVIVFIDHLQVWPVSTKDYRDQIDKEGFLIKGFNSIALEKNVTMFLISQTNKESLKEGELDFKSVNFDKLLAAVKGSVDIVYLATGIWSLLKTGMEIERPPLMDKHNPRYLERPAIYLKILLLVTTERQAASRAYWVLYDPLKQKFSVHLPETKGTTNSDLRKQLTDEYKLKAEEIKELLEKPEPPKREPRPKIEDVTKALLAAINGTQTTKGAQQ